MSWDGSCFAWLVYSALLSFVILAVGSGGVLFCRQPARRLRIIELASAGCLIAPMLGMIPGYPRLSIGWLPARAPQRHEVSTIPSMEPRAAPVVGQPQVAPRPTATLPSKQIVSTIAQVAQPSKHISWLIAVYLLGVAVGLVWWFVGMLALMRIIRTANPAPRRCRELLAQIAGQRSKRICLLVSRRAKQPFASVAWSATIILPEELCGDEQAVRWALTHEWTHIARHDFRAWFLAGLVRVLFFYQPLAWWLRQQLRLCQDYLADAEASRQTPHAEDYAEFLTVRATAGSLHPAMIGIGMGFRKSQLYRRIVMLVQNPTLESRTPRLWTISVGVVALLLVSSVAALSIVPKVVAQGEPVAVKGAAEEDHSALTTSSSIPPDLQKPVVGKNFAILPVPVLTEAQREFRWAYKDAKLFVFINGRALLNDKNTELNTAPLDYFALIEGVYKYKTAGVRGRTVFEVTGVPREPEPRWSPEGKRIDDESQESHLRAAFVLGGYFEKDANATGKIYVEYITDRDKDWDSVIRSVLKAPTEEELKRESGIGDDLVKVFPLCTPLSRYMVYNLANCMIRYEKSVEKYTPEEIKALPVRAKNYLDQLGLKERPKICVVENFENPPSYDQANQASEKLSAGLKAQGIDRTMTTAYQVGKSFPKVTSTADSDDKEMHKTAEKSPPDRNPTSAAEKAGPAGDGDNKDAAKASDEFKRLYALKEGECLKRIAPPFSPARQDYFGQTILGKEKDSRRAPAVMCLSWRDGNIKWEIMSTEMDLRDLQRIADVYPQDIEGDVELLKSRIQGDWIVREGTAKKEIFAAMEEILNNECHLDVKLSLREIERKVFVAQGDVQLRTEGNRNGIEIYGKSISRVIHGGGRGDFDKFLKYVGNYIRRQIVNSVKNPPTDLPQWNFNDDVPGFGPIGNAEEHDPASVLKHITEQTGITFTEETRSVPVLFVEKAK